MQCYTMGQLHPISHAEDCKCYKKLYGIEPTHQLPNDYDLYKLGDRFALVNDNETIYVSDKMVNRLIYYKCQVLIDPDKSNFPLIYPVKLDLVNKGYKGISVTATLGIPPNSFSSQDDVDMIIEKVTNWHVKHKHLRETHLIYIFNHKYTFTPLVVSKLQTLGYSVSLVKRGRTKTNLLTVDL